MLQIGEQGLLIVRIADHVAHLPLGMHTLGKGTEIEANHRFL